VKCIEAIDPDPDLDRLSLPRIAHAAIGVDFHHLNAEHLPFESERFDTVVSTFTLCSIPDVVHALGEVRRILKPGGQFLFLEHGRSPDARVARWQDRLNGAWMPLAGGCHLNRPMRELVEGAGLQIGPAQHYYLKHAPRFVGYLTEGIARKGDGG
jgi:ubiquinone/menaquinone biosynthesis C-methylase UbiE